MSKAPLSIRIIYIFSRIVYLLTSLTCMVVIVISFFLFTGIFLDDLNMDIELPVKSDVEQAGKVYFYGQEMDVTFAGAEGKVSFTDAPKIVTRTFPILMIISFFTLFFLVHLFFMFIKNVRKGVIFEIDNIKILRKLGITLLGFYFFLLVTTQIWKNGFSFNPGISDVSISIFRGNLPILFGGLFLLMLSQIFIRGLEFQEENKLTI